MKTEIRIINIITIWLIVVTSSAIGMSYLSDYLNEINWFGDYVNKYDSLVWGTRHRWYVFSSVVLFVISLGRVLVLIGYIAENERKN